jgi:hypothetical protein
MKALALFGLGLLGLLLALLWTLILLAVFMVAAALSASVLSWLGSLSARRREARPTPAPALNRAASHVANPR